MELDGVELRYRVGRARTSLGEEQPRRGGRSPQALGADPGRAGEALAGMKPPKGPRSSVTGSRANGGVVEVIDESYNANPGLHARRDQSAGEQRGPRRIAALGDMLELGDAQRASSTAELAEALAESQVDRVFTVGSAMRHLHAALPSRTGAASMWSSADRRWCRS